MPKIAKALTASEAAKLEGDGRYMVGGVQGIHLKIKGNSKCWILRALVYGRRRDYGLGPYPAITLETARKQAAELHNRFRLGHSK